MKVYFDKKVCDISQSYIDSIMGVNNLEISSLEEADVICYISCAYEKNRIDNSLSAIKRIIERKKITSKIAIFGCATEYKEFYHQVSSLPEINYIGCGTGIKMQEEIVKYLSKQCEETNILLPNLGYSFNTSKRLTITIQDGCNNRCAFCKSNYLHLHTKSIPIENLLEAIQLASSKYGITEVNITGLNPTQYGIDLYKKSRLTELIQEVSKISGINTILLDMLCIQDMTKDLILEIISNPKIKRLMMPIQSLDNRLLNLMRRRNTAEEAEGIIHLINKERPDIFLETIFLACYPTETEDSINKTIELLNNAKIDNPVISVYKYGENVPSLYSEHISPVSHSRHNELLYYYATNVLPIIEKQRRELLAKPVCGTLIHQEGNYDYYSTLYRFTTNEYTVQCKREKESQLFEEKELEVDFLPSLPNVIYLTERRNGNGRVLRKY